MGVDNLADSSMLRSIFANHIALHWSGNHVAAGISVGRDRWCVVDVLAAVYRNAP